MDDEVDEVEELTRCIIEVTDPKTGRSYYWDQFSNDTSFSFEKLFGKRIHARMREIQEAQRKEVYKVVQEWLGDFLSRCERKAQAVQRMGWRTVLAIDVSRRYTFYLLRYIQGRIAYWSRESNMLKDFITKDADAERERWDAEKEAERRKAENDVLVYCHMALSGDDLLFVMSKDDTIHELKKRIEAYLCVHHSAGSSATSCSGARSACETAPIFGIRVLGPGCTLDVDRYHVSIRELIEGSIQVGALHKGGRPPFLDAEGALHFDVVLNRVCRRELALWGTP